MAQQVREFASSSENLSPLPGPTWWEKEPAPEGHSLLSTHKMFKIKIKIKTTRHVATAAGRWQVGNFSQVRKDPGPLPLGTVLFWTQKLLWSLLLPILNVWIWLATLKGPEEEATTIQTKRNETYGTGGFRYSWDSESKTCGCWVTRWTHPLRQHLRSGEGRFRFFLVWP